MLSPSRRFSSSDGGLRRHRGRKFKSPIRLPSTARRPRPSPLSTDLYDERPVVYADGDERAQELQSDADTSRQALIVCDNLEVSADGRRIYFSEPFDYSGASVDDALDEAIALAPNGRLWRYDLDTGSTRLIAEGFQFINGLLVNLHPAQAREASVLVTQTSQFRLTRFHIAGPQAGRRRSCSTG